MDSAKKKTPDYTDIAYRDAVARLRYLLAESYAPASTSKYSQAHIKRDESDNETEASFAASDRSRHGNMHAPGHFGSHSHYRPTTYGSKRALHLDSPPKLTHTYSSLNAPLADATNSALPKTEGSSQPPVELMAFIERQEEYIEQLEKESQYCRDELAHLLGKVKEVISENEGLHAKEKAGLLKSVFDSYETGDDDDENELDGDEKLEKKKPSEVKKKHLEGPSILFESRISELEAQLTQSKMDLKKAQEEAELYKKKLSDQNFTSDTSFLPMPNSLKQQLDTLQREKDELSETVSKLQASLVQYRDKEVESAHKAKRSMDIVDQAQFEKTQGEGEMRELRRCCQQAELEVRRLKEELDRQHEKMCELLQEQARKVQDERTQAERRYAHQVEQLSTELAAQWDNASRLQLELDRQRRTEQELRRELQQKASIIDELKKELATKTSGLQSEVMQATVERGSVEQELAASRLAAERAERDARQEVSRLQAEVTALRQRLDRTDADLMHSRRENLRLNEQIASLERELNLAKMLRESSEKTAESSAKQKSSLRDKDLQSAIMDMDAKHVQTVAELESMIQSQNQVMEKLKDECRLLTQKLEESSMRHKEERMGLKQENAGLSRRLEQLWESCKDLMNSHELQITPTMGIQMASTSKQTTSHSMKQSTHNLNSMMTPTTDSSLIQTRQSTTSSKMTPTTTPSSPITILSSPITIHSSSITMPNSLITKVRDTTTNHSCNMNLPGNMECKASTNLEASSSARLIMTPPGDLHPNSSLHLHPSSKNTKVTTGSTNNSKHDELNLPGNRNINRSLDLLDGEPSNILPSRRNISSIALKSPSSLNFSHSSGSPEDRGCSTTVPDENVSPLLDRGFRPRETRQVSRSHDSSPTNLLSDENPHLGANIPTSSTKLSAPPTQDTRRNRQRMSPSHPSPAPWDSRGQTSRSPTHGTHHQTQAQCTPHHRPDAHSSSRSSVDSLEPHIPSHPTLHAWRSWAVDEKPLTLEDLATDSDSRDSQSAQLFVFR